MSKCKDCDPFKNYDALIILTRQGTVMTSNDAKLTFDEDAELYKLGRVIATRTKREEAEERKNTQKSRIPRRLVKRRRNRMKDKTGSTNGFRAINTQGGLETKRQRAATEAKMFQFMQTKRGGSKTTKGKFKKGR